MDRASQVQRATLRVFLLLFALFAGLAIFAVVGITGTRLDEELILSIVLSAAAGVLGLISGIVWSRRLWHPIGPLGMFLTAGALSSTLFLLWTYDAWRRGGGWNSGLLPWWLSNEAWSASGVLWLLAAAMVHIALFSFAQLKRQYRWVLRGTILTIFLLVGWIFLLILDDTFHLSIGSSMTTFKVLAVLAILDIAGSLAVPILHRFSVLDKREAVQTVPLELAITCPRCSTAQTLAPGRSSCDRCGLKFNIEIEENVCEKCGYALYKLESDVCPECGTPFFSPVRTENSA